MEMEMEFGMEVLVQTAIQKPRNFDMRISSQQQSEGVVFFHSAQDSPPTVL